MSVSAHGPDQPDTYVYPKGPSGQPERDYYARDAAIDKDAYDARWEGMWRVGLKPGEAFDAASASPALKDLLASSSGRVTVEGKRVIVPGCGRGYDVVEFAQAGASECLGVELAPTAAADASAYVSTSLPTELQPKASVVASDFFKLAESPPGGQFDVGYDYTFFCAMHPSLRPAWAKAWAASIKPGGELITLIFPIDPTRESGPPFAVTPSEYKEHLEPVGFEAISIEPVPAKLSHKGRGGKEALGRWRRKA